jgi:flagellar basal-body rod protein FlgG
MLYGLYASGLGALGQSHRLDIIANNLANVNTPGFRRDRISFKERLTEALEDTPDLKYYNSLVHRYGGAPFVDGVSYDTDPGGFEATGRTLDFAINGPGFFAVRDLNTRQLYYTRAGNFIFDSAGHLVTPDGKYEVLDRNGVGLSIDPTNPDSQIRVDPEGKFFQGAEDRGILQVVDFANPNGLRKHGDNLFRNVAGDPIEAKGYRLEQGTLEGSSVNPVAEMVEMIKTIRAIESNLQMVHIQDTVLDRTVNDFGRVQR